MRVAQIYANDMILPVSKVRKREFPRLTEGFLLCNNSMLGKQEIGDATELALLHMGKDMGYDGKDCWNSIPGLLRYPLIQKRNI